MTTALPARSRPYAELLDVTTASPPVVVVGAALVALVVGALAALAPAAALGLSLAAGVAALAWHRPVVPGVLVVAVCPALSGVSRSLGVGPFKLSEALLLLCAGLVLLRRPALGDRTRGADVALLVYAVLGAGFALAHTATGDSTVTSWFRVGLGPLLLVLSYWTASRAVRDAAGLVVALRVLLLGSLVPSLLAVGQGFDVPGTRGLLISLTKGPSLAKPGAAGVARVTGPYPSWHSLAAYLVIPTVLAFVLLLRRSSAVLPQRWLLVVLAVDTAALVLSLTATVVVWTVGAVLLVAWRRQRLGAALAALAAVAAVGGVLFAGPIAGRVAEQQERTSVVENPDTPRFVPQTVSYRLLVWRRDYVPLLERALPAGISNELPESVVFAHSENEFITLTLRGGVLLVLGAVLAMGWIGRDLRREGRADGVVGDTAKVQLAVLVLLPVTCMIWPYFTNAGFPQTFFAVTGAVAGAARAARA